MSRFDDLSQEVESLYSQKLASREDWADWLYPNHVLVVARNAKALAEKVGADAELAQVAALLHDVADIRMKRANPDHETESLNIARELMRKHGYTDDEIRLVVDDAIRFHSCHGDERPASKEGLVLAAADALAHFQTDYYIFTAVGFGKSGRDHETFKKWVLAKIERDFTNKIAFDEVRETVRPDYTRMKELCSR